jgi:hypothetical protein
MAQTNQTLQRIGQETIKGIGVLQTLLSRAVKTKELRHWAEEVKKDIAFDEIIDRLDKNNQALWAPDNQKNDNQKNPVEWYLTWAQVQAELFTRVLAALSAHTLQLTTELPILKQLNSALDQLVSLLVKGSMAVLAWSKQNEIVQAGASKLGILSESGNSLFNLQGNDEKKVQKEIWEEVTKNVEGITERASGQTDNNLTTIAVVVDTCLKVTLLQSLLITGILSGAAKKGGEKAMALLTGNDLEIAQELVGLLQDFTKTFCKLKGDLEVDVLRGLSKCFGHISKILQKVYSNVDCTQHHGPQSPASAAS